MIFLNTKIRLGRLAAIIAASCPFFAHSQAHPFLEWVNHYNTGSSWGVSTCLDINGNIYTTGSFDDTLIANTINGTDTLTATGAYDNCFIQKLDANGNLIWSKGIQASSEVLGCSIVTDSLENVYVLGRVSGSTDFDPGGNVVSHTTAGTFDHFVVKLDVDGNFVWVKILEANAACFAAGASSITLDKQNNLILIGVFSGTVDFDPGPLTEYITPAPGDVDMFIEKLDSAGNLIWVKTLKPDGCTSIISDEHSNLYITGGFHDTIDFDPGPSIAERISASFSYLDVYLLKLDSSGNFKWVNTFGAGFGDVGKDICIDNSGNVYTVGSFRASVDFNPSLSETNVITAVGADNSFIQKVDSLGNFIWAKSMKSLTGGINYNAATCAAIDGDGNILVGGYYAGTSYLYSSSDTTTYTTDGNTDLYVQKLDSAGNYIWGISLSGSWYEVSNDIMVDSEDAVYFTGRFFDEVNFNPFGTPFQTNTGINSVFVAKYVEEYLTIRDDTGTHGFELYPNPAQDLIWLSDVDKNTEVCLMDLHGRVVYSTIAQNSAIALDVSHFERGIYLVQVKSASGIATKKIVLQ